MPCVRSEELDQSMIAGMANELRCKRTQYLLCTPSVCVDPPLPVHVSKHIRRMAGTFALVLAALVANVPTYGQTELTGIGKIATGGWHACALTTTGGVK